MSNLTYDGRRRKKIIECLKKDPKLHTLELVIINLTSDITNITFFFLLCAISLQDISNHGSPQLPILFSFVFPPFPHLLHSVPPSSVQYVLCVSNSPNCLSSLCASEISTLSS